MDFQNKFDLQGKLNRYPLAEILVEISRARLSGSMRIENDEQKIVLYFEDGELVFVASNARKHKFFEILLREKKITPQLLSEIKDFVNDLKLKEELLVRNLLSKVEINDIFARQFDSILQEVIVWSDGVWTFTPLARIRNEMRQQFDFRELLLEYGRNIGNKAVQRFKSFQESFRVRKNQIEINLQPEEAFVLSRFENKSLSIEEVRNISGLPETDTFRILYGLWLGGFLIRENWNAAFSANKLNEINSAKLQLKVAPPEIKIENCSKPPEIVEKKLPEAEPEKKITLENYLEQIENAESHYELLGVSTAASNQEIKSAYFRYAKQFHPDLFYKNVEPAKHKQIQLAFTEIAQAYDTLRTPETREVYDFKLRKHLDFKSKKSNTDAALVNENVSENESMAAQIFEHGFTLLMDENFEQALPYLMRAVDLVGDNARYRAYYGKALAGTGKNHRADSELQAAVKLDPKNVDFRLMIVKLYMEVGLNKRAEGELKRLLDIAPGNYEAQTLLQTVRSGSS